MTQEEKQLLLQDLCARLPYGVKINREWIAPMSGSPEHSTMELDTFDIEIIKTSIELGKEGNYRGGKMKGLTICDDGKNHFVRGYMCKPYLRPMSSMTEKEKKEFKDTFNGFFQYFNHGIISDSRVWDKNEAVFVGELSCSRLVDWLNKHHFDYRGLIPMGLALEAPDGMYNLEKK